MRPELKEKIIAYNKTIAEKKEKATDMDILIGEILTLPYGQVKKIMTEQVMEILAKYGYE